MGYVRASGLGKAYKRYATKWGRLAEWVGAQEDAPVIMLTSGVPEMLKRARTRCPNVRALLSKPYSYEELERNLRLLLRRTDGAA